MKCTFGALAAAVALFLVSGVPAWSATNVAVFVNGNNDCCAGEMHRLTRHLRNKGFTVKEVTWSNFKEGWRSGSTLTDEGKRRFVRTGKEYLRGLRRGTNVYLIGHSWGGDSILRLVQAYRGNNVNFRLVAVIDPVGSGGFRRPLQQVRIPSKVGYFYNRWQRNEPFPNDFKSNGTMKCARPVACDQREQSSHKKRQRDEREAVLRDS